MKPEEDFLISQHFSQINDYISRLEEYALMGMVNEVVTHEFNTHLAVMNRHIANLPDEHEYIKKTYPKMMGLLEGLTSRTYVNSIRASITYKDLVRMVFLIDKDVEVVCQEGHEKSVHLHRYNVLFSVLAEMINNGKSTGIIILERT
jgi:hypothetical protein